MGCLVRYLSSAGIQHREVKGVEALASAYPSNWLMFASLVAFPPNQSPIEIDLLVVMDDRIVLLELKDWNGPLTQSNDVWIHGSRKQRSPVILGNEKAKKVKSFLTSHIRNLRTFVDSKVVLTGTSTRELLSEIEKPHVLTLEEAKLLGNKSERNRLLGPVSVTAVRPNMLVKDFERLLGNASYFQPLRMIWDGYGVVEENFYLHRGGVWSEHRAQLVREERTKALLRLWRFDKLPVSLNEPKGRRLIAERELRANAFLDERGSWVAKTGILKQVGSLPDEVLTEHYQILSVPSGWTTLRRYFAKHAGQLNSEHRVDIAHTLALTVAELHSHDVAHRDIGDASIWLGEPTSLQLTGFSSASIPDDKSIPEYLGVLGTYSEHEPDWGDLKPTGKERDVRSIGLIMRDLARMDGDTTSLPDGWDIIVEKALRRPGERYPDAIALAEALGELKSPAGPKVDQSRLDDFETQTIPYVMYPALGQVHQGGNSTRYNSTLDDHRVVVKVWNGLLRGNAERDHALLSMLEVASSLNAMPIAGVAQVAAFGLSQVGAFVVTRWADGEALGSGARSDTAGTLRVAKNLVATVEYLHARNISHGDLHPDNVLVDAAGVVTLIDVLDISRVGEGRVTTPAWSPDDRERCTNEQIDRFAVCKMVGLLAERDGSPAVAEVARVVAEELQRRPIETLRPLAEAIDRTVQQFGHRPPPVYRLTIPGARHTEFTGDRGKMWVKVYRSGDRDVVWISGLRSRLLIRMRGGQVELAEISDTPFAELGQGAHTEMVLSVKSGAQMEGVGELAAILIASVPAMEEAPEVIIRETPEWEGEDENDGFLEEVSPADSPPAVSNPPLDIGKIWLRAAEIEEQTILQVKVDRRIADAGDSAIFVLDSPKQLEFEDDDIVEVRRGGMQGWRIGFLDVPRCDQKHLAIRELRQSISDGEVISLIDRRDRISKERRRRAVERIAGGEGVIPNLIHYFDPNADTPELDYGLEVNDDELAAYELNEGQRLAFRSLLRGGPLGLLQGPPGSGKTRFIASLAHWLLAKGGARRVLIASQSHEAVNNVLEEILKTYRARGGVADVLRVGSRGATERIRPYQARSLRDRYRIRFENGLKERVASAAGVAGITKSFVHELVQVDQRLGSLKRSIELSRISLEEALSSDERKRGETKIDRLQQAFARAASELLEREVSTDGLDTTAAIQAANEAVLVRHTKASPSDLNTARKLLDLANEWKDTLGTGHRNFDEFLAKTRRVVAGTCVGIGQSQIRLEHSTFDWVIVDEAARCTSGELAVPLQLGSRVLLVGDQRQLRPMVDRAVQLGLREEFGPLGKEIARSDFERAFDSSYGRRHARVLDEQYRMTPVISELVSSIFYAPHGVRLKPSANRIADAAFAHLPADISQPVVWYDTSAFPDPNERDRNEHRDIWNESEISTAISLLTRLSREEALVEELAKRGDAEIGVICMYSEQKRRLEREWSQQPFSDLFRRIVSIDTVDAYQGKENAIVIVSLVRANDQAIVGHVGRENRCNVAMSRAKERLYIIGSAKMWAGQRIRSPMKQVLASIRRLGSEAGSVRDARGIAQ